MEFLEVRNMAVVKNPPSSFLNLLKIRAVDYEGKVKHTLVLYNKISNNKFEVPRALAKRLPDNCNKWENYTIADNINLRDYQKEIFKDMLKHYKNNSGGILQAKTGFGKTVVALKFAVNTPYKTLVIVPTTLLMKQWIERIQDFTGLKKDDIGIIQGSTIKVEGKPIVIGMLKSLAEKEYPEDIYKMFGLTIYDEGHLLGAKTFSTVAPKFWDRYRLMLSATPRRKDGTENVFRFHIGTQINNDTGKQAKLKVVMVVNTKRYNPHNFFGYGKFLLSRFLNTVSRDTNRNKLIVNLINKAVNKDRKVLVLSDRLEQLQAISTLLHPIKHGWAIGDKKENLNEQVVLGTYQVAGLGMDIPELDTLIFATPRTDIEQAVGRITRKSDLKKQPLVIDIVDENVEPILAFSYKRRRFYNNIKAETKIYRR